MKLYHYSALPLAFNKGRTYEQPSEHFKPNGFWLSVDDDWKRWCDGDFNQDGFAYRVELTLRDDANILRLTNAEALDAFTREYNLRGTPMLDRLRCIDWPRIVSQYDGILIAPYIWERRLASHTFWYYCWDCASACIWNLNALEVVSETHEGRTARETQRV